VVTVNRLMVRLIAVVVVAAAAAVMPAVLTEPRLIDLTAAVAFAGPAAGAAIAVAAGRPSLARAALAGTGAYVSGIAALHGLSIPLAVLGGMGAACVAGGFLALVGGGLDAARFLAFSLLAALGGGAAVLAYPSVTGAESGLGPLPRLSVPIGGGDVAVLGPAGAYHVVLAVAVIGVMAATVLLARGPGPRWRAVGGDRERAAMAGLRPLRTEVEVLGVAALVAGGCGAVAAHAAAVATPSAFSPDAAALPLLAALLAGRAGPALAAGIAVAAGVAGQVVLPAAGYAGPPSAQALATGAVALAVVLSIPAARLRRPATTGSPVPAAAVTGEWPVLQPRAPTGLTVRGLGVTAGSAGPPLVVGLDLDVAAGSIHGLVGANGSGKTSVLRAIARRRGLATVLLPQHGGGWPGCSTLETLRLAARAGGCSAAGATDMARQWLVRLGLGGQATVFCEELPAGARRRLELGRVLLLRPSVLLCDEPLAGLDGAERELAMALLAAAAAQGVAILVAEHDLASLAALASSSTRLDPNAATLSPVPAT
jgi:ABC-type Mn2+/Zn2+ transport system ATPase subunit/ABC-type branched-subunit amino acid transport system permease subunit